MARRYNLDDGSAVENRKDHPKAGYNQILDEEFSEEVGKDHPISLQKTVLDDCM